MRDRDGLQRRWTPTKPYSPLYARAVGMPRPWGVTALFASTGTQQPLVCGLSLERGVRTIVGSHRAAAEPIAVEDARWSLPNRRPLQRDARNPQIDTSSSRAPAGVQYGEFAALNRSEPAALALAGDGATSTSPSTETS
jgi:hypothetical protein